MTEVEAFELVVSHLQKENRELRARAEKAEAIRPELIRIRDDCLRLVGVNIGGTATAYLKVSQRLSSVLG